MKNKSKKIFHQEEGVALALVLIMVILISLTLVAVSFLTQSANTTLQTSIKQNELRTNDVSEGINQVLSTIGNNYGFGSDVSLNKTCEDPKAIPSGTKLITSDPTVAIDKNVSISCTEPTNSGSYQAPADYIFSGNTLNSSNSKTIGQDGGLFIQSSSTPIALSSGIINASGGWKNVSQSTVNLKTAVSKSALDTSKVVYSSNSVSYTFAGLLTSNPLKIGDNVTISGFQYCSYSGFFAFLCLVPGVATSSPLNGTYQVIGVNSTSPFGFTLKQSPGTFDAAFSNQASASFTLNVQPSIIQPDPNLLGCAATAVSGNCNCPLPSASVNNPLDSCTYLPASDLTPTSNTYVAAYLNHIAAALPTLPTTLATQTGNTCKKNGNNYSGTFTWSPGEIVTGDVNSGLGLLNAETTNATYSGCVLNFQPGTYWFNTTSPWTITNGMTVIGGSIKNNGCDTSKPGVELQFGAPSTTSGGSGSLQITKGTLSLCSIPSTTTPSFGLPVIAAPQQGSAAPFFWTDNGNPVFQVCSSSITNNTCTSGANTVNVDLNGPVYEPAGYVDFDLGSNVNINFNDSNNGAVFRAMTLHENGGAMTSSLKPAPFFDGGRLVQLRFYNNQSKTDIGIVQIEIDDAFGQAYANKYKIISWRAAA